MLSFIFELELDSFVILIVIIDVITEDILSRCTYTTILCLCIICISQEILSWLHTDILVQEFLSRILIHEVTGIDKSSLFLLFLHEDLLELLDNGFLDFLEFKLHSLVHRALGYSLIELLINLRDDPMQPVVHLIKSELHLLVHINYLLIFLLLALEVRV